MQLSSTTMQSSFGRPPLFQPNPYLDGFGQHSRTQVPTYTNNMITVKYTYMHDLSSVGMPSEKRTKVWTESVDLNRAVRGIKERIASEWNYPVQQQVLYFRRGDKKTKLNDGDTLLHYGITGGTTLILKVPPVPLSYVERRKLEEKEARDKRIKFAHHKKISYTRYGNGSVEHMNL